MKKITTLLLVILVITGINLSCERDDICPEDTPSTPRLYISFVDNDDFDISKDITEFRVEALVGEVTKALDDYSGTASSSEVLLPLKTTENTTQFVLYKNYGLDDEDMLVSTANPDTLTITYSREDIFVSRACGYKTIFKNVEVSIENEDEDDNENWILNTQSINDNLNVEDETEAHFNFAH